jgi:hypothetical protein
MIADRRSNSTEYGEIKVVALQLDTKTLRKGIKTFRVMEKFDEPLYVVKYFTDELAKRPELSVSDKLVKGLIRL